jgi:hypothetical protein
MAQKGEEANAIAVLHHDIIISADTDDLITHRSSIQILPSLKAISPALLVLLPATWLAYPGPIVPDSPMDAWPGPPARASPTIRTTMLQTMREHR